MTNIINAAVCYIWKLLRVNPDFSTPGKNYFLFLYVSKPYEMTTCDKYFMMYVSQIMLYTLSL